MRATLIEELEIASEGQRCVRHRLVAVPVDLLILDRASEPLDEDVVARAAGRGRRTSDVFVARIAAARTQFNSRGIYQSRGWAIGALKELCAARDASIR